MEIYHSFLQLNCVCSFVLALFYMTLLVLLPPAFFCPKGILLPHACVGCKHVFNDLSSVVGCCPIPIIAAMLGPLFGLVGIFVCLVQLRLVRNTTKVFPTNFRRLGVLSYGKLQFSAGAGFSDVQWCICKYS